MFGFGLSAAIPQYAPHCEQLEARVGYVGGRPLEKFCLASNPHKRYTEEHPPTAEVASLSAGTLALAKCWNPVLAEMPNFFGSGDIGKAGLELSEKGTFTALLRCSDALPQNTGTRADYEKNSSRLR